jgi:dTDP-4-amino-4,6-dideoxygalactose transaminase
VYGWYRESLPSGVSLLCPREGTEPNYAYLPVLFGSRRERDAAYGSLERAGIHPRKYFYPLVSACRPYQNIKGRPTPVADSLSARVLCLPLYPDLSREEVERIIGLLED